MGRELERRDEGGHGDFDPALDTPAPAARGPQKQVRLDRAEPADRAARGVERQARGAPRLARPAGPERRARGGRGLDRDRDAVTTPHCDTIDRQAHRRACLRECAQRVPERSRPTRRRGGRHEQRRARRDGAEPCEHTPPRPAREDSPDRWRGAVDRLRGARVGQREQLDTHATGRGGSEHADDASGTAPDFPLCEATELSRGRVAPPPARDPQHGRGDPDDHEPGTDHAHDARCEAHAERRDRTGQPGAREQQRRRAGARVRQPQPPQAGRGAPLGHRVELTAYVKRFTPMRNAASCSSGVSWWTSGSSHPSPRSV